MLFLRRPGGQPQLSISLGAQASQMSSIRELQIWIAEHLDGRLSIEDLADRMAMSVRNFERVINAFYPTVTDPRLTGWRRTVLKAVSAWRYRLQWYNAPYELRALHRPSQRAIRS